MTTLMWNRTHVHLEPEPVDVVGRTAAFFSWTDGIKDIASWFVELPNELLEFDCVGPGLCDPEGQIDVREANPRELGGRILASLRWTDR